MTPVFCCGFECGQTGNVGQHWGNVAGAPALDTAIKRNGARSMRFNFAATSGDFDNRTFSSTVMVGRVYIYFTTLPNADVILFTFYDGAAASVPGAVFKVADSKIYPGSHDGGAAFTFGSTGVTVTTGTWYRIDLKVNTVANPWTIDLSLNGTTTTQLTKAIAGVTLTRCIIGTNTNSTCDFYLDDIIVSQTAGDYPIGAGYVNHFVPTSDGTHTSTGTLIEKGTIATPTGGGGITSATTDAFNWVNGVPLLGGATDNTRLINNSGTTTALYCEEIFGAAPGIATPSSPPRAVEVITADRQAATTVGVFSTKLNDNGTESTIINRTGAGVVTDRFVTKQYATPPTGGAWTLVSGAGNFNNIRARFGYSSDANPDQYWRGIMIEAEFEAAVVSTNLLPFCIAPQGTR